MPDTYTHPPLPFIAPAEPVMNTARAGRLRDAAESLRIMAGELVRRGQRDPTCLRPLLADVLQLIADGNEEEARAELRRWVAMDRAMGGGHA
jgi:hypothetical protein